MAEPPDLDLCLRLLAELSRLLFSQADAADLRESDDAGWNHVIANVALASLDVLDCDLSLRRGHMRQHGLADHISNRVEARHVGFQPLIDQDLASLAHFHPDLLQSDVL